MAVTDVSGMSHQVVAIGRVYQDHEEIRLKIQEMYPYVDRIVIAEGRTNDIHNDGPETDMRTLGSIPDPLGKIKIIHNAGGWDSNLHAMIALWDCVRDGEITYIFGADEYMSTGTWDMVLMQFAGGIGAKFYNGATRVNLPLFDLWHDFNWRCDIPFQWHERFILKQPGMVWKNHFTLEPDSIKNARMVNLIDVCGTNAAIYHTCWTKDIHHLISRCEAYARRDLKLSKIPDITKFNYPSAHIYLGDFISGSVKGYHRFPRSELPEILKRHSAYNYRWNMKKIDVGETIDAKSPHITIASKPRVVYLTHDNTANIPYNVVQSLVSLGYRARLIQEVQTWLNYPHGEMLNALPNSRLYPTLKQNPYYIPSFADDVQRIEQAINDADIVIWNEALTSLEYHWLPLSQLLTGKKVVRIGHGTYIRKHFGEIDKLIKQHNIISLVTTPDLVSLLPSSIWWCAPVSVCGVKPNKTLKPSITHAPTNRGIKSSDLFEGAVKGLPIEYLPINKVPHVSALQIMARGWMHYDQMSLRVYGVSAIEGALLSSIVLVNHDKFPVGQKPPFVNVNETNIKDQIIKVLGMDNDERAAIVKAQYEYAKANHDPDKQAQKIIDIAIAGAYFK